MKTKSIPLLAGLLLSLGLAPARAATLTVTDTADSGPGTLRQAIADAAPGDAISFAVTGDITLQTKLTIAKGLTITGPGATNLTILGYGGTRLFDVTDGPVVISGVKLANGVDWFESPTGGGAILNSADLTLDSCELTDNRSTYLGGAVLNNGAFAKLTAVNCTFAGNSSGGGGGAICSYGPLNITNGTFSGNSTDSSGGALLNYGDATIVSCTIVQNLAYFGTGGGIFEGGSTLTLQNSIVALNANPFAGNTQRDLAGGFIAGGDYNLIQYTNELTIPGTHNVLGQNPILTPLRFLGGPTRTRGLGSTSPALDVADGSTSPATDQRGMARPNGAGFDIGAYEGALPPNNAPVVANPISPVLAQYGGQVQFVLPANTFADPDQGQTLSYSMVDPSFAFNFNPATRTISGTAYQVGTTTLTMIATDDGAPALSVSHTFQIVVSKRPITVRANDLNQPRGVSPGPFSATYFNLVGPATEIDVPPTLTTSATASSPPGTYSITVSGGSDDNYEFVGWTNGTLKVLDFSVDYGVVRSFGFPERCGYSPETALVEAGDGILYGTASVGVFRIGQDGTGYQLIFRFNDGTSRSLGLAAGQDGALYGTTFNGGASDFGSVFKVNRDGSGYQLLHSFAGGASDGDSPVDIIQANNGVLYGLTRGGFGGGKATVFRIETNGANYSILHEFANGVQPWCLFQSSDGKLYGTTSSFSASEVVFRLELDGGGFTTLYTFTSGHTPTLREASDGAFYGVNTYGNVVFKLNRDGTGYMNLYNFTGPGDGSYPFDTVVEGSDGALYGTTYFGGTGFAGNIFKLNKDGTGYSILRQNDYEGGPRSIVTRLTAGSGGSLHGVSTIGGAQEHGCVFKLNPNGSEFAVTWSFTSSGGDGVGPGPGSTLNPGPTGLIEGSDGRFYGVTSAGGEDGGGVVFGMDKDGGGYALLHQFTGAGGEGYAPIAPLLEGLDGALYGSTSNDRANYSGAIFRINKDGSGFSVLHAFAGSPMDGSGPAGALVQGTDGLLYGVTSAGGTNYAGTLFSLNTNGSGFSNRVHFSFLEGNTPQSLLPGGDDLFYVVLTAGGAFGGGQIVRMDKDGNDRMVLHDFLEGSDGSYPNGQVIIGSDGKMYGVTAFGGVNGGGTIFKLALDVSSYEVLHSFASDSPDGALPFGGVRQGLDGALYGLCVQGASSSGSLFRILTDGSDFCVLRRFGSGAGDGIQPHSSLVLASDGALYGTTTYGGSLSGGTVFRVALGGNQPPVVSAAIPDQVATYGSAYNDTFPPGTFTDPDAGQMLNYSASGLPPGITFDGPSRTWSGTPTNTGNYPVTITATDNGTPAMSTNTTFQFTVAPALLTVTADNNSRAFGQADPVFTGSLLGVTNGDNITASFSSAATPSSPPGNYPILPTLNDPDNRLPNYTANTNLGTLTVTCPSNLFVTTTADSGPGSLRQAILDANAFACANDLTISFDIPGSGVQTIAPLTPLPDITRRVAIDGYTQPGASPNTLAVGDDAVLRIELSGTNLTGLSANGLYIQASACTVRGLVINGFTAGYGAILVRFADSNVFEGNFIGTDATGTNASPNFTGIVTFSSLGNRIGGLPPAARNIIGGCDIGISLAYDSTGNQVLGNYIGLGADGLTVVSNTSYGVTVTDAGNRIGGAVPGARNVISGNHVGCALIGAELQGNFIGTDATGTLPRGNFYGVHMPNAWNNLVGGSSSGEGNLISANASGVVIEGELSTNNVVAGNLIGTDATGTNALGNGVYGVVITHGSANTVGGTAPGARNVICRNEYAGVAVVYPAASNNVVQANFIGVDVTGTNGLGNGQFGVLISGVSSGNLVGGTTAAARNVISDNFHGVAVYGGSSNVIQGNFIGTDATGLRAAGNTGRGVNVDLDAPGTLVGGTNAGAGNLISGNGGDAIHLRSPGCVVQGNLIGTDGTGTNAMLNSNGIFINDTAPFTLIGGTSRAARNVINAGNAGIGVYSPTNTIQGNYVGIGADGQTSVGNFGDQGYGIVVTMYSSHNLIGGDTAGAGNVVCNQYGDGIRLVGSNNVVQGNLIGTDATGMLARGSRINGILVINAPGNLIGGQTPGARNLVSGNGNGITVSDGGATQNTIQGNLIGTDITGTNALPNDNSGISLEYASANLVGGTVAAARNVIAGNGGFGVGLSYPTCASNVVQGNYVGLAADGTTPLPNFAGIRMVTDAHDNLIGGTTTGAGNFIAHNTRYGISVVTDGATNNAFLGNSIFANGWLGIDLGEDEVTPNDPGDADGSPNHLQNHPELTSAVIGGGLVHLGYRVDSTAANSAYPLTVEFFISDGDGEGRTLMHRTTYSTPQADATILFTPLVAVAPGHQIVATATGVNGNTSEFSPQTTVSAGAPVSLSIGNSGGTPTVSWPAAALGFVLEYTDNLSPPIHWQPVTDGIVESGGVKSYAVTNTPGVPMRFYRLQFQ